MAFYGTMATGAGWIVPKKYIEKVGDDGFKKQPIGLGPVQVRQPHAGRRAGHGGLRGLLAQDALGEAPGVQERARGDHARGHAQERRGGRRLPARRADRAGAEARSQLPAGRSPAPSASTTWTSSTSGIRSRRGPTGACAWPPATPSIARRSARPRRSAPRARPAASCRARSSSRCRCEPYAYDPAKAKKLLAEAGYPNGFDAGDFYPSRPTSRPARRSSATSARSASA